MVKRYELHDELLLFTDKVYFQPPSNVQLKYPCIVYKKEPGVSTYANDHRYRHKTQYQLTVIDRNPDSVIAEEICDTMMYATVSNVFVLDNLNHTIVTLHY